MEKIRELLTHKNKKTRSMQMTISISFTILSVCCMCLLGVMLYQQFTRKTENLQSKIQGSFLIRRPSIWRII